MGGVAETSIGTGPLVQPDVLRSCTVPGPTGTTGGSCPMTTQCGRRTSGTTVMVSGPDLNTASTSAGKFEPVTQ